MIDYNKTEIRNSLALENIFDLLQEWGGDPEYTDFGILSSTICHNHPGEGSKKLYFYDNSGLFKCYTGCDSYFDIFELVIKIAKIQQDKDFDLNDAVRFIAIKFGLSGTETEDDNDKIIDWKYFANYERIQEIELKQKHIILKEYDNNILSHLNYNVRLLPWLLEGISQEAINQSRIGYYPGADQISIPHFDKDNRFIGLRGRTLCAAESDLYGKYRPMLINRQLYNHPLGMNLYNLNFSKNNIRIMEKAIVFEGEKSCLLYKSYFGLDRDISVACCGSNISAYQIQLLLESGAKEIIVAFDRQFKDIGDKEFQHLKTNLLRLHNKYKNFVTISFIFDKNKILSYKASPIDEGKDKFLTLFKGRIIL